MGCNRKFYVSLEYQDCQKRKINCSGKNERDLKPRGTERIAHPRLTNPLQFSMLFFNVINFKITQKMNKPCVK